jgi:hypothetical protein
VDLSEYDCQRVTCGLAPDSYEHDLDCMFREGPYCLPPSEQNPADPSPHHH